MAIRFPDKWNNMMPSNRLLKNPHKGFTTFQRFALDPLNEGWTPKTGWKMEHIAPWVLEQQNAEICLRENQNNGPDLEPQGDKSPKMTERHEISQNEMVQISSQSGTFYPESTIAYFRIPWRRIETKQGEYDFSLIDYVLEEADKRGQQVMFRFPPHAARPGDLDLPEWFRKELGLSDREVGNKQTPDHPLYYEAYGNMIRAVGRHMDGDSRVTAVDMALVSAWGEGDQIDMLTEAKWKSLVDAYMEGFQKTPMSAQFNHPASVQYANTYRPVGFRADCLGNMTWHMVNYYPLMFPLLGDELWKKAPVAFESCWVIKHWLDMGWDIDYIIEQSLKWHITSLNPKSVAMPEIWQDKIEDWIKKMGYRFSVRRVAYPSLACPGDALKLHLWVENKGVAPIYHRYPVVFRLRRMGEGTTKEALESNVAHEREAEPVITEAQTENGIAKSRKLIYTFTSKADITTWLPGDILLDEILQLPEQMEAGSYALEVGIQDTKVRISLANDVEEQDGFYRIAENIQIVGKAES